MQVSNSLSILHQDILLRKNPHVFYKSKRLCERNKLRKMVSYYLDNIFISKQSATYNKLKPTYWGYSLLAEKALIVDL